MRVGIVSDFINSSSGGIGNYVYNLINELLKSQEHISLINHKEITLFDTCNQIVIPNHFKIFSETVLWYPYLSLRRKYLNGLDIVHNPTQVPTFFRIKQKYIITIHDLTPFVVPKEHPVYRVIIFRLLLSRTLKTADKIITVSNSTKRDLIDYFNIKEEKIRVIPEAVDAKFKQLNNDERKERIGKKYNLRYPFILYVGTLEPRKNIPTLIKAFYKLKAKNLPHKLVITGKKGWKYKEIFETIDKHNLRNDVIFTGYVSVEDLPALYNAADLFAYPSIYEGFGLPPLEAMACGTPIITLNLKNTNNEALRFILGDVI